MEEKKKEKLYMLLQEQSYTNSSIIFVIKEI